jgi:hypothetical protein
MFDINDIDDLPAPPKMTIYLGEQSERRVWSGAMLLASATLAP